MSAACRSISYFFDPLSGTRATTTSRTTPQYLPNILYLVTLRARGIEAEGLLEGVYDPYVFYRDAYRQRRLYDIYDGEPPRRSSSRCRASNEIDVDKLLDEQHEYEKKHGDKSGKLTRMIRELDGARIDASRRLAGDPTAGCD